MRSQELTAKKLQTAITTKFGIRLFINRHQRWSEEKNLATTYYVVKKEEVNEATGKKVTTELFTGNSSIQLVLFMRDYWYILNGMELPTDNQMWNEIRDRKLGREWGKEALKRDQNQGHA